MYENINIPTPFINQYETISSSPVHTQQHVCISLESNSSDQTPTFLKLDSITPSFQKKFPIVSITILGVFELISGLIVLGFEFIIFDITLGLWCGGIYALAGAMILVLVLGTDRERHQISAVLIFQLVALMFTITELLLHSEFYRTRCLSKPNEPTREMTIHCQIVLIQMVAASVVLVCTILFSIIYFRVTLIVLKQAHGTFNISNAFQITSC